MAQGLFTVNGALSDIEHHISPNKIRLMFAAGATESELVYRFKIAHEAIIAVSSQLDKVRRAAVESGCQAVLDLLDEKSIPSGHDFEALSRQDRRM